MNFLIYAIGFLAQGFFSARILVQWLMSERAHRVLSPTLFWVLSIIGSYLLCVYGFLRHDFAIVLGQFISYYVYLWNLKAKGVWCPLHGVWKVVLLLTPVVVMLYVAGDAGRFAADFFHNDKVPMWLLVYESAGQVIFTLRFLYQIPMIENDDKPNKLTTLIFNIIAIVGVAVVIRLLPRFSQKVHLLYP